MYSLGSRLEAHHTGGLSHLTTFVGDRYPSSPNPRQNGRRENVVQTHNKSTLWNTHLFSCPCTFDGEVTYPSVYSTKHDTSLDRSLE